MIAEIDPLDSNCDRRKLPWDKLNLSDKATPEKKNKKSRKASMTQNCTQIDKTYATIERSPLSLANSTVAGEHLFRNYQSSAKAEMISPDESR